MKKYIFIISLVVFCLTQFTACVDKEPVAPEFNIPTAGLTANKTIAQIKSLSNGNLVRIDSNFIIKGIVMANDKSGNLYKTMFIQDETAGIEIKIDKSYTYNLFKVGQRVFIKCQGLYVGVYGGVQQLGYIYSNSIGRIPDILVPQHFFVDSLPSKITKIDTIKSQTQLFDGLIGKLVCFKKFHFETPLKPFFVDGEDDPSTRYMLDSLEKSIEVRTSSYADFAKYSIPRGEGNIVGVLSKYNGTWQVTIPDYESMKLDPSIVMNITMINELFDNDPALWIKYNASNGRNWEWSSQYKAMVGNNYGAPIAGSTANTWLVSPEIDLTGVQSPILNFRTWTKYSDNGLGTNKSFEVYVLKNYTQGDNPANVNKDEITAQCQLSASGSGAWKDSGDVPLNGYNQKIRIAFRYQASGTVSNAATTWEVDGFKVKGKF